MSSTAASNSQDAQAVRLIAARSPLAQLLHALNQPLTGLQCSMEVALAVPRTPDQYMRSLRDGLELTERMRALVEAIREVADAEPEKQPRGNQQPGNQQPEDGRRETVDLKTMLAETVADLVPVAEPKNVRIQLECFEASVPALVLGRQRFNSAIFRCLESALSLTARDNVLLVEIGAIPAECWIRIRWQMGRPLAPFSRPELGLMVAQAAFEGAGATWQREPTETFETVTVRFPMVAGGRAPS